MEYFFKGYGNTINGIIHLSPKEAYELCLKGTILLDVRPELLISYKTFDVPNYLYCFHEEIKNQYKHLPENKPIIVADAVGLRSKEVVQFLMGNGYKLIANLVGGITDWEKDGLPMIFDIKQILTGSCMCQIRAWGTNKQ